MATITTRAGFYVLNWQDAQGRHRKSLGRIELLSKREVDAILRAKQYELSTGTRILRINRAPVATFAHYAADYLRWHAMEYPSSHPRIRQIFQHHLLPRFGARPLDQIAIGEVEQYKTERRFRVSAGTVEKELRVLKAAINRAVLLRLIAENPIAAVKAPRMLESKPHRFYEADELQRLYQASRRTVNAGEGPQPDPLYASIWKLYANTGMRRMEGLQLRWRDIGEQALRILSTGEARTKSGKWREVPLSDGAREALSALPRTDYVLPRIAKESLSRAFMRDARTAGLDGSLHTLRHTYISHLVRSGTPLRTVQLYVGHAHITTTEGYAYLAPGCAPQAVLRLDI